MLAALSLAAAFVPAARPAVLVADALVLLAFLVDGLRAPRPARFALDRELPEVVGLSTEFERRLRIAAPTERAAGLEVHVHEDFPDCFEVVGRTLIEPGSEPAGDDPSGGPEVLVLSEAGEALALRTYRSTRRGAFRFGDLRLSVTGRWGLARRQARFAGSQELAVESALLELRSTLALAASERWRDLGVRRRARLGGQTEFESLRDYVRGDDVRLVDWKAFARRGKPTVRTFREERGQELVLLFDCGRRMRSTAREVTERGATSWSKLDWALDAGLQLAAVALQAGDRVGCLVFDDATRAWVPPSRGKRQFAKLREAVFGFQPSRRDSSLGRALRELAVRHRRSATVAILTDVDDPLSLEEQRRALSAASRRHRLVFACLDDPDVRRAAAGELALEPDAYPPAVALRAAALGAIEERRRSLRSLASTGVRVLDALPAEAAGPLLTAWLDARRTG